MSKRIRSTEEDGDGKDWRGMFRVLGQQGNLDILTLQKLARTSPKLYEGYYLKALINLYNWSVDIKKKIQDLKSLWGTSFFGPTETSLGELQKHFAETHGRDIVKLTIELNAPWQILLDNQEASQDRFLVSSIYMHSEDGEPTTMQQIDDRFLTWPVILDTKRRVLVRGDAPGPLPKKPTTEEIFVSTSQHIAKRIQDISWKIFVIRNLKEHGHI